jgi:hypothetical protein
MNRTLPSWFLGSNLSCTSMCEGFSLDIKCFNEGNSLFDFLLVFKVCLHEYHSSLATSSWDNQIPESLRQKKSWEFFQSPHFEKKVGSTPMRKWHFFGYEFSFEQHSQHIFKLYRKKGVLPIYRTMSRMLGFLGYINALEGIRNRRCFWALCSVNRRVQH